jgi:hypothetical protein
MAARRCARSAWDEAAAMLTGGPSPARCGGRSGLKQESNPAQWVAGTLARVNLVAGRCSWCRRREKRLSSPVGWVGAPARGASHQHRGDRKQSPARPVRKRPSMWPIGVAPRDRAPAPGPGHLPLGGGHDGPPKTPAGGAEAARGRRGVPVGAVIPFPSGMPPPVASPPPVPVGDPSALELGPLPAGRKSPDDSEILAGWRGGSRCHAYGGPGRRRQHPSR